MPDESVSLYKVDYEAIYARKPENIAVSCQRRVVAADATSAINRVRHRQENPLIPLTVEDEKGRCSYALLHLRIHEVTKISDIDIV